MNTIRPLSLHVSRHPALIPEQGIGLPASIFCLPVLTRKAVLEGRYTGDFAADVEHASRGFGAPSC